MGSTAASGGLMVSMAGKRVFANASTVTGSIGVRMDIPRSGACWTSWALAARP